MRILDKYLFVSLSAALSLLSASCSKDPAAEPAPGERVQIVPAVWVAPGVEAETKSPADGSTSLTLQFLRADESAAGTYGAYAATALPAARTAGSGAQALTFTPVQYYATTGLKTKLVGWYPAGTLGGGVMTWNFNGTQDIMTAPKQEGSALSAMPAFTFSHRLSQLQFFPYYDKADAAAVWGKVTAVKVTEQRATCAFTPASAEDTGAVAFSGGATTTFTVAGASSATAPGVGKGAAVRFGDAMMIEPQTASTYVLTVTVTTEKGGDMVMKVPARSYPEGVSTKVWLKLSAFGFMAEATIADWAAPEDWDIASTAACVPVYYGNSAQNGGVTTGLSGFTVDTYDNYTLSSNGSYQATEALALTNEKPFYGFDVVLPRRDSLVTKWEDAWQICKDKLTDGGGWRLPRCSELKLIYNNLSSLNTEYGFYPFAGDYWSGTEASADKVYSLNFDNGTVNQVAKDGGSRGIQVRCVREGRRVGKVSNDGVVFWVDPVAPAHYKVVAMDDQSSGAIWSAQKAYVLGAAGQSQDDGKANCAAVKAYSLANAGGKTTGVLQTDFPAFGACENYQSPDGMRDWFLPASSELKMVADLLSVLNPVFTANGGSPPQAADYWASVESSQNTACANNIYMGNGGLYWHNGKDKAKRVRCIREFNRPE